MHEEGLEPPHLAVPEPKAGRTLHDTASTRNLEHEKARRTANPQDSPGSTEGVGHVVTLQSSAALTSAAPVLRALMEAVLVGVQREDVAHARAAARALAAYLEGLPQATPTDGVIKLSDVSATYGMSPNRAPALAS